jgi:hypothetical protein
LKNEKKQSFFSFFQKMMPVTDWSQEEMRTPFNNLLRRIDRLFTKISKRPSTKVGLVNFNKIELI